MPALEEDGVDDAVDFRGHLVDGAAAVEHDPTLGFGRGHLQVALADARVEGQVEA